MTDIIQFESHRLRNVEAAIQLLEEAKTIEEVTHIRDYAEAVRLVARQAKVGLRAQNEAAEIKLRAERRAGEMLAQIPRITPEESGAMAHRGDHLDDHLKSYASVIKSNDIHEQTAHNWQRIAEIPEARRSTMAEPV